MLYIFQSLSAGATLLLTFLILTNPKGSNRKANLWLGVFLFCVFFLMLDDLLFSGGLYRNYPHLIGFVPVFSLLAPPSLFMSVSYFVTPNRKWKGPDLANFSLLFLFLLISLPFFLQSGEAKFIEEFENTEEENDLALLILIFLCFAQIFVYWYFSFRKLKRHQYNSSLFSAANQDIDLKWLQYFSFVYLLMVFLWFLSILIQETWLITTAYSVYFFGAFLLAYFATQQEDVFPKNEAEKKEIEQFIFDTKKIKKEKPALLSQEELTAKKVSLLEIMEIEKPYLNNELNLPQLAKYLNLSTNQLSYLLNTALGVNFSTFVNKYRAEEAKKLLQDPQKEFYSLLQVAYEAGYNSKTVFNTHFKKVSGLSPSAFKKAHIS